MNHSNLLEKSDAGKGAEWTDIVKPEYMEAVENRIISQLLETLLYERIVPFERESLPGGEERFIVPVQTTDGGTAAYVCIGRIKQSFGRIRIRQNPVRRIEPGGVTTEARLTEFVTEVLGNAGCEERIPVFYDELIQTLLKDTQAHALRSSVPLSETERSYDALEANVLDGHPYHPCYKSRVGFSLADNAAYGPEFKPEVKPLWLAVSVEECRLSHSSSVDYAAFIRRELGEDTLMRFQEKIKEAGGEPEAFTLLAVHPWQWREIIGAAFYRNIAEGRIIALGEGGDSYLPQQSIRTLSNATSPYKAYLKLPLSITNTSTGRILARHTILNAPLISDWLHGLIDGDPVAVKTNVVLLREVAGAAFDHETLPELAQAKAYGTLGVIWRESLHGYLSKGEEAVPFNGLCHVEATGRPLIAAWIERYGVLEWTEALIRSSVVPLIHMLYAHGVALESHAQNMILIHKDGKPERVALKDFHDGIRFSRRHLADPDACPTLHPVPSHHPKINRNSFIETDDPAVVRDFVHDAFFFINLAELCMFLEERFGQEETAFWRIVAKVIREYQREHPQHRKRFEQFDLFADTIQVEQLTKRRLFGDSEFRMHDVPNPLSHFR
ncbi:IucA/IucC family protein [Paenibacillus prosopidis]|uniref:Siderophore synthetase component n=1 Tax=Paenibacillus prosopidis TaxID=630520 RepID=A0A368VL66_9BACL|nr:IucA/IucC family protein [Paenibacillus prosopidis]RCW42250.1 siderophore synthetase component [Paenibacillus prosopidis]